MVNKHLFVHEAQLQLDEVSALLKKIKVKLRAKQVKGVDIPDELLILMSGLSRQEAAIWWNIRRIQIANEKSWKPLQGDTQNQMNGFRESCARAMTLLPLD